MGYIKIGRFFEGSVLVPPLNVGKTLAHFSCDGKCPLIILLFTSSVIDGNKISAANFIIFGPMPSMPVALVESSLFMNYITRPRVIRGV